MGGREGGEEGADARARQRADALEPARAHHGVQWALSSPGTRELLHPRPRHKTRGADEDGADVREDDCMRVPVLPLRLERGQAVVLERVLCLLVPVRDLRERLERSGFRRGDGAGGERELRDAVDPDLVRGRAERERVAVPQDEVGVVPCG